LRLFQLEQRRRTTPAMMSLRESQGADAHPMEEDMNKSLIALATAAVAIAATVSQAEAGHGFHLGFGGIGLGFGAFHNYGSYEAPSRVYRAERVQERAPVRARKSNVAQDDDKQADKTVAQNENSSITVAEPKVASIENSSITVASVDDAKKVEPVKITETAKTAEAAKTIDPVKTADTTKSEPAVAQKLDCKKFFPSVGLTLTVPCE
jgi:hypothetical protein